MRVRRILWENGLSLALIGLFLLSIVGQIGTGLLTYNE